MSRAGAMPWGGKPAPPRTRQSSPPVSPPPVSMREIMTPSGPRRAATCGCRVVGGRVPWEPGAAHPEPARRPQERATLDRAASSLPGQLWHAQGCGHTLVPNTNPAGAAHLAVRAVLDCSIHRGAPLQAPHQRGLQGSAETRDVRFSSSNVPERVWAVTSSGTRVCKMDYSTHSHHPTPQQPTLSRAGSTSHPVPPAGLPHQTPAQGSSRCCSRPPCAAVWRGE